MFWVVKWELFINGGWRKVGAVVGGDLPIALCCRLSSVE